MAGDARVALRDGTVIQADTDGRAGEIAVGVRPEKISLGGQGINTITGTVTESAYIGVATEVVVSTASGDVTVFHQNVEAGGGARARDAGEPVVGARRDLRRRPRRGERLMTPLESLALTRRQLVQRGATGITILSLPGMLAACGGGGNRRRRWRARRRAPLRQLAALHRHRREDEEAADPRAVHEKTGIRVDYFEEINDNAEYFARSRAAVAGPGDRPRHLRLHRQLAFPGPADRRGLGAEARQGADPQRHQPDRRPRRARRSTPTASTPCPGSPA